MSKKAKSKSPEERARRDVAQARLRLEAAQETYAQERVRGQQEVERARLKAAKWLARAAQRIERRQEQLAEAENHAVDVGTGEPPSVTTIPEVAADRLEQVQADALESTNADGPIVVAHSAEAVAVEESPKD